MKYPTSRIRYFSQYCLAICFIASASSIAAPLPKWAEAPKVNNTASLTLKEAILRAFSRNPSISQAIAQVSVGHAQVDEAKSAWHPQIGLTGSTGRSQQTDSSGSMVGSASYGISFSQLVYDFGKTSNNIKQQEIMTDAYRYKLMAVMTDIGEKTTLAYLQVRRYQALYQAIQENLVSLEKIRHMAELRANAGLSTRSDVLQAETRISSINATLEQYKSQLETAEAQLSVLTGIKATNLPDLPTELLNQPVSLNDISYQFSPDVRSAQAQKEAVDYGVEKAKSQYWPTLSVQGGRTRYETNTRSYWNDQVQLNVSAPLYQGGAVSAQVKQAEGSRQMAVSQVEQAKFDILSAASSAYSNWMGARAREKAGQLQLASAKNTRDVYLNEYKLSTRSLNDLLSIEQDVFQAVTSQLIADFDGWDAAVSYAATIDNLLPLLGVIRTSNDSLPNL